MSARQHEERGGAGDSGILVYPRRPEPGAVLLSTCHRPDQRTRSNLTANSTEHLPDWPAQNVNKMLIASCGCVWLTDQIFDLTGTAISRVQNRYNLSVPNVFFSDLALPTVPQSQRDTLIHVDRKSVV